MACKGAVSLNEPSCAHIFERGLLCDDQRGLGELRGKKETVGMAKGVLGGTDIYVSKKWEGLDVTILIHGIVRHVHVPLANGLAFDASEVDGLLLWILFD